MANLKTGITSMSDRIKALKIGETTSFPLEKLRTVRARASELGLQSGRRYRTAASREERVIIVQRTA